MKNHTVTFLKALADQTRIDIIKELLKKKEMSCQQLMKKFSLSQPTLSHHFNKLVDNHILLSRREGALWFYTLNQSLLKQKGIDVKRLLNKPAHH
jgi:ArsR family transcriptional regulator